MFSTLAGFAMAAKVHFTQMKYPLIKKNDRGAAECIYMNKVEKLEEKEKYEKSKMAESGYMTVAEYEEKSRAKNKREIEVGKPNMPKDSNMVYVPQKNFKLVKYNNPVGSPELNLPRKLNFDRQINAQGIISGNKDMLVYPSVYYYAQTDCTSCDLFLIKLDSSLSDTERVMKANVIQREESPLLSTSKDINVKYVFRTLTPIDFSKDNNRLAIKEKIGYRHDGIWQTNLWVYDFKLKRARMLPEVREAIINYWAQREGVDFEGSRWDIYPLGFDANDDNRIVLCAYAFTGNVPKFLGTWSVATDGTDSRIETLDGAGIPVSVVGYRLEEDTLKDLSEIEFEAKQARKDEKEKNKNMKTEEKLQKAIEKIEYKRKIQQMDMDTLFKIQQRQEKLKQ